METSVNNKCKAFTSLEQSRKLAEILPLESADMYYSYYHNPISGTSYYEEYPIFHIPINKNKSLHCWSLAALIGVLPNENMLVKTTDSEYYCIAIDVTTKHYNNPIDACYEVILKLNELNLL